MVEVDFENFVNYLRSGNTDKLNIISFQQNQQHKINLSTQLIFYRILTKTVVQLREYFKNLDLYSPSRVRIIANARLFTFANGARTHEIFFGRLLTNVSKMMLDVVTFCKWYF
ncbi:Hypothetical_protein [Hexamita inflata]|uniref:Hypothetical_protein n=1 Tax=Hexamita inflata TaxID=28002 RepID=A0AA86USI0_9EUKA|nr:Hypothetical protein HINF_LOCUS50671 [Hexamita inflata]